MSLFQDHESRHQLLDDMAFKLVCLASLLELHGWYAQALERGKDFHAAAADAQEAAAILRGERQ